MTEMSVQPNIMPPNSEAPAQVAVPEPSTAVGSIENGGAVLGNQPEPLPPVNQVVP